MFEPRGPQPEGWALGTRLTAQVDLGRCAIISLPKEPLEFPRSPKPVHPEKTDIGGHCATPAAGAHGPHMPRHSRATCRQRPRSGRTDSEAGQQLSRRTRGRGHGAPCPEVRWVPGRCPGPAGGGLERPAPGSPAGSARPGPAPPCRPVPAGPGPGSGFSGRRGAGRAGAAGSPPSAPRCPSPGPSGRLPARPRRRPIAPGSERVSSFPDPGGPERQREFR